MKNKTTSAELEKDLNKVIKIDEAQIHSHLDTMVRETVEETLNRMLNEEADRLCNAQRYEHKDSRTDTRSRSLSPQASRKGRYDQPESAQVA